ncbi:hypothetical protein KUTeg_021118 [Tegillarca granosa]|uniref:Cell division cycle protein 123 homolog n=1 Tax=Tegillarca granosa TaxID=220873 RepID=A0ABQ9ECJ3_TEGGR|nr:hypothetical protein KUTeg_021118 [Tegillarca granosa]
MKVCEVQHCNFSVWYPKFKELTIRSYVLPLPEEFLEYLHADGVVLPQGSAIGNTVYDEDDINGEDLNVDWDEDEAQAESPQFPELEAVVRQKINKLGGAIFPKLNWSSPRDASWIALDKTLKCTCPSDIYLLLKSSQFISYDLTKAFVNCEDYEEEKDKINMKYELVLRRWIDLNPALEFRCFVKNNKLFAVSQRNSTIYYEHIHKQQDQILSDIKTFYEHCIEFKFPSQNYVFDIYRKDEIPAFRYVEKNDAFQPSPYASYGVPLDIIDLSTGEDPYKLIDFLKLKIQSQNEESSDSEDENNTVHRSHQNT